LLQSLEACVRVADGDDLEALSLQPANQRSAKHRIVIDDQNGIAAHSPLRRERL